MLKHVLLPRYSLFESLSVSVSSLLNSDFELPAPIAAALILFMVSSAWSFRAHVATHLVAPTCQFRIRNGSFRIGEEKNLEIKSKTHGINLISTLNVE